MESRPTLDVVHLRVSKTLMKERQRYIRSVVKANLTKDQRKLCREILSKYRRKQRRRSGSTESDPDPYDETYVFYCVSI
jgi:hypothetical protein